MFSTITVGILRPIQTDTDEFEDPIYKWEKEEVDCVLCSPGSTRDLDATRPAGVEVTYTFHFPYWYDKPLRGCKILFNDTEFRVVGDPQPYMISNTPMDWNRPVEVENCDG